jgi:hypothetical protein
VRYETALNDVSEWWAAMPAHTPAATPEPARLPVYSTWYNYHQDVDAAVLVKEIIVARQLGYGSIIVDDGWQTLDSGRGYAYTGDWKPERMPEMKRFVDESHRIGMKVLLWYAVPFVGKHSQAAARFKNKSLRFDMLKFGLDSFCHEMLKGGAPLKMADDEPVIGRFFGPDDPLLFNESYGAKPAAYGVQDALVRR